MWKGLRGSNCYQTEYLLSWYRKSFLCNIVEMNCHAWMRDTVSKIISLTQLFQRHAKEEESEMRRIKKYYIACNISNFGPQLIALLLRTTHSPLTSWRWRTLYDGRESCPRPDLAHRLPCELLLPGSISALRSFFNTNNVHLKVPSPSTIPYFPYACIAISKIVVRMGIVVSMRPSGANAATRDGQANVVRSRLSCGRWST